jgi:DNA polymerase III subunit delta'
VAQGKAAVVTLHPLIGHGKARAALASALARGTLPAAILIHGARGVGKQRLALWLAQLLVCESPRAEPCGECTPCRMAMALEHPDIHWYFPLPRPKNASGDKLMDALEEARQEELAQMRTQPLRPSHTEEVRGLYVGMVRNMRARAHMRPVMAAGQVFIVGEAELLVPQESSPEAANALLKLLEEPPGNARFVLASSEPGRLLPTIRSRTVPLHLSQLRTDEVESFLEREAGIDVETAAWAAALAQGSPGRALGLVPDGEEPGGLEALRRRAFDIVVAATAPSASAGYGIALSFPPAGARSLVELFGFVEEWLRDLAAVGTGAQALNADSLQELRRLSATDLTPFDVAHAFASVERARELALANVNPQLVVSGLVRDLHAVLRPEATAGALA